MNEIKSCFKSTLDLGNKFEEWNSRFVNVEQMMQIHKDEMQQCLVKIETNELKNKMTMDRLDEMA